jgi:hypothetical protein
MAGTTRGPPASPASTADTARASSTVSRPGMRVPIGSSRNRRYSGGLISRKKEPRPLPYSLNGRISLRELGEAAEERCRSSTKTRRRCSPPDGTIVGGMVVTLEAAAGIFRWMQSSEILGDDSSLYGLARVAAISTGSRGGGVWRGASLSHCFRFVAALPFAVDRATDAVDGHAFFDRHGPNGASCRPPCFDGALARLRRGQCPHVRRPSLRRLWSW